MLSDPCLLTVALTHAERGWRVLPLKARAKTPAITRWPDQATTDLETIRRWWRHTPDRNVGIACGPSDLVVIDLDSPRHADTGDRHDGREVLINLAAQAGEPLPVPTYTVATPSRGWHLYYHAPADTPLPNSSGRLGPSIDTRARGGYVVAAGSVLPAGVYRLTDPRDPIPLPDWLTTRLAPAPSPSAPSAAREMSTAVGWPVGRAHPTIRDPAAYVAAALRNQAARVRSAQPGNRHHALLLAANSLGGLVATGLLDAHTARVTLLDAASVHVGIQAFSAHEAERTIDDGIAYATRTAA
ncbi:bifunctional DNA primase/polymerase [Nocardia puris]|uniref:Bifunctional DNA primase/polymerase-like protein n=1 Tax=Nocardia puris TaxID=208602 RepID=A0A366CW22_9NOCA|nr:bifunctional DNA primase/polymerase [Nocardia puris]MBF6370092.1 bifunctional DNA primase/polymerase [Nocardia puris]RBO79937.1 bifunctional DNA primase/polymerase-like protein [Nocardia puris]